MGETENNLLKIYMGKIISYGGEYYEKLSRRKKQKNRIGVAVGGQVGPSEQVTRSCIDLAGKASQAD